MASTRGRLADRIAIVTGASNGIGRAIALAYSREGARVVCADIKGVTHEGDLTPTHNAIVQSGGQAVFVKTDVSDPAQVENLVARTVQEYGRLDIMVNNAGISFESKDPNPIWDLPFTNWETTQKINSTGVFLGTKYAAKQMITQQPLATGDRGWIINTASIFGNVGQARTAAYCASKGAVVNLTRAAALDCAPYQVHVNAVAPGYCETDMPGPALAVPEIRERLVAAHPFRGIGRPEDIAKACVFLASDDAGWVTGHCLAVDGGYLAR